MKKKICRSNFKYKRSIFIRLVIDEKKIREKIEIINDKGDDKKNWRMFLWRN